MIDTIKLAFLSAMKPFNFALWIILIVILTVAGPFGTYETVSVGWRLVYWAIVVLVSAMMGYFATHIARYLTQRRHPLVTDLVASGFMMLSFAPLNLVLTQNLVVRPDAEGPTLLLMMGYVGAIAFGILTGRRFIPGLEDKNYLPRSHDINQPRLLRRLPENTQSEVIRLSSQDHFVDVVTTGGSNRLRMRLADAIDEMDGVLGYCTHRSHWVAETAIQTIQKDDGKVQIRLTNGDLVPVSRKYKADLEKAGVL